MKANVIVNHTGFNEQNFSIFKHINTLVEDVNNEISVSYLNLTNNIANSAFAIMGVSQIYHMSNMNIVATCIDTADILSKANVNSNKYFYMWDIGFLLYPFDFEMTYSTLSNVRLITRSESHASIIKANFNLSSYIVPEFDLEKICNLHK